MHKPKSMMRRAARIVQAALFCIAMILIIMGWKAPSAQAGNADLKAPPPLVAPPPPAERNTPEYKQAVSRALINRVVEQHKLPYIMVKGHDVKIAIRQEVLDAFKLQSGQEVDSTLMFQIIEADRAFSSAAEKLKKLQNNGTTQQ